MGDNEVFDYVVIGTGAGGSVVASRLSEDPSVSVLVVESGGSDRDPFISIPKGFFFLYGGTKHSFNYQTLPAGPGQNAETWQRGRVLGGSTSLNGMQYERGGRHYWDRVGEFIGEDWGWHEALAAFRSLEDHELGASETRGAGGPLRVEVARKSEELNERIFEAAELAGLDRVEDINASDAPRVGYTPNTIRGGMRLSAARAFLRPALGRKNLRLELDSHVGWILFDGNRASGVRIRSDGRVRDVRARREVIVCAGALDTPLLLERSGIGNAEALSRIGVPVRVESPNVGEHAIEQRQLAYQARITEPIGYNEQLSSVLRQMLSGTKYFATRKGVLSTGAYDISAFTKSDESRDDADIMTILNPLSLDLTAPGLKVAHKPGFQAAAYLLHPTTESSVHSSGSQPGNPPVIEPHYLETEYDRAGTIAALRHIRKIADQRPLADIIEAEEAPGSDVQSDEEIVSHAWASGHILHAVGSARMGPADEDAVDSRLRVRGVEGLRIADSSVLPVQPGNTQGPTMMVGWRAADFVREEHE